MITLKDVEDLGFALESRSEATMMKRAIIVPESVERAMHESYWKKRDEIGDEPTVIMRTVDGRQWFCQCDSAGIFDFRREVPCWEYGFRRGDMAVVCSIAQWDGYVSQAVLERGEGFRYVGWFSEDCGPDKFEEWAEGVEKKRKEYKNK